VSHFLEAVAESEQRQPEEVAVELIASGAVQYDLANDTYQRWRMLSSREQQVTALVCLGYTTDQIAIKLIISPETVKSHIKRALVKFDLHSRDELRMLMSTWHFSGWD